MGCCNLFELWANPGLFFVYLCPFSYSNNNYSFNFININWKKHRCMLGIWNQGRWNLNADETMELWRPPGYNLLISQSPSKKHSVKYVEVLFLDKSSWGHLCNGFLLYAHFIWCQFADYQYCYYHFEHYLWLVLLCSAPIHLVPFVCFLKWANPGLFFVYFRSFQTNIQYTVPGFEPTTFVTWVSSHNHYTRAPAIVPLCLVSLYLL